MALSSSVLRFPNGGQISLRAHDQTHVVIQSSALETDKTESNPAIVRFRSRFTPHPPGRSRNAAPAREIAKKCAWSIDILDRHPAAEESVREMGNDGGSIPTRRELVKEAARNPTTAEVKESQHEQQEYHWSTDPISREPLSQPVVSDSSGKLYNKSTILEYLVEGARKGDADTITQGAIKSLKDVVEVKFEVDEAATGKANGSVKRQYWKCPVTGDKLGPGAKAAYIVPCGHAFSGSAIKEVSGEKCLTCETEYASNDIIPILPITETDIARLSLRVKTLLEKGLSHSLKKASGGKKRKKKDETAEDGAEEEKKKLSKAEAEVNGSNGINNSSTASITAKVLKEQEQSKKRRMENENVKSLFSTRDQSKPSGTSGDFMTRGFTVPSKSKG